MLTVEKSTARIFQSRFADMDECGKITASTDTYENVRKPVVTIICELDCVRISVKTYRTIVLYQHCDQQKAVSMIVSIVQLQIADQHTGSRLLLCPRENEVIYQEYR